MSLPNRVALSAGVIAALAVIFLISTSRTPAPVPSAPPPALLRELNALHEEHARRVEAFLQSNQGQPNEEVRDGLEALHRDLERGVQEALRKHAALPPE